MVTKPKRTNLAPTPQSSGDAVIDVQLYERAFSTSVSSSNVVHSLAHADGFTEPSADTRINEDFKACVSDPVLTTTISGENGAKFFAWAYTVTVINNSSRSIKLLGRRWDVSSERLHENFAVIGGGFASSLVGACPTLGPHDIYKYRAGVAMQDGTCFILSGALDAIDLDEGLRLNIDVPAYDFNGKSAKVPHEDLGLLSHEDALALRQAVGDFNKALDRDNRALFRTDDLDLSSHGISLLVHFLIIEGQYNRLKDLDCDFSPIMPARARCSLYRITDHYFYPNDIASDFDAEQRLLDILETAKQRLSFDWIARAAIECSSSLGGAQGTNDKAVAFVVVRSYNWPIVLPAAIKNGAALEKEFKRILAISIEILGVSRVKEIVAASAPAGNSALVETGMVTREFVSSEPPPPLTDAELAAFRKHAAANPWKGKSVPYADDDTVKSGGSARSESKSASKHIRDTFAKWLETGRLRRAHFQNLPGQNATLYGAYVKEVQRHKERRIPNLWQQPYRVTDDTPRPVSHLRLADLSEEGKALKREWERNRHPKRPSPRASRLVWTKLDR